MTLELPHDEYVIRRKFLRLFGNEFRVFDPAGNQVLFSRQKAFKLREDIRVWSGDDMQTELLRIAARQIVDFSAAYDVIDSTTNAKVGAFKRKGLKSIVRDEWILMDANDQEIGLFQEDSVGMAILRRFINIIPQKFHMDVGAAHVANLRQNWNPFVVKVTVDFSPDTQKVLDKRFGIAVAILHSAIEGRQS
ncbi:MAG TPA: hypothetical protein VJ922_07685 [Actinomycetota bacterium]|nr:hypothetical protein [Actinomycetota bacterium]